MFDNPKPFDDLTTLVHYLTGPDDLVMDFFAGSGSTGHGVWLANQKFGTQRRFILVQLDVAVNVDVVSGKNALAVGLESIDQITAERLRRVSKQLKGEGARGDLGFRVLREDAPDLARPQTLPAERLASRERQLRLGYREIEPREKRRSTLRPSDLIPELLLLLGFPLDAAGEQVPQLHANTVWRFTHPRVAVPVLACLDESVEEDLEDQLRRFLHGKPVHTFVCRDESLNNNNQLSHRLHDITSLKVL